ncbi:MAG: hypothetical protein JXB30_06235 [Anaerolineae bacterium]|nr:hypothetical protein [Anaerolineae bacterium]
MSDKERRDVLKKHRDVIKKRRHVIKEHRDVIRKHCHVMKKHRDVMKEHRHVLKEHRDVTKKHRHVIKKHRHVYALLRMDMNLYFLIWILYLDIRRSLRMRGVSFPRKRESTAAL